MKNALLAAVVMSSVLLVGCNNTDEISDEGTSTGIGYSEQNQTPVTNNPSDTEKSVETLREKADKKLDSMDDAVQKMSEEFADTVDSIKKGAQETADDVKKSINDMRNHSSSSSDGATRIQPKDSIDKKLQDIRNDLTNSSTTEPSSAPVEDPSRGSNTATDLNP